MNTLAFSISGLKKSRIFIGFLISIHLFALMCCDSILPDALHVIVLFFFTLSFLFYLERGQSVIALQYVKKTAWILRFADDRVAQMQLLPSSVMMRYFLILHFVSDKGKEKHTVVLFSDMFDDLAYRGVRRCVRMGFL